MRRAGGRLIWPPRLVVRAELGLELEVEVEIEVTLFAALIMLRLRCSFLSGLVQAGQPPV